MTSEKQELQEEWRSHVLNWQRSSMGIRAYCREKGIRASQFYYWQRKMNRRLPAIRKSTSPSLAAFVPVAVRAENPKPMTSLPDSKKIQTDKKFDN